MNKALLIFFLFVFKCDLKLKIMDHNDCIVIISSSSDEEEKNISKSKEKKRIESNDVCSNLEMQVARLSEITIVKVPRTNCNDEILTAEVKMDLFTNEMETEEFANVEKNTTEQSLQIQTATKEITKENAQIISEVAKDSIPEVGNSFNITVPVLKLNVGTQTETEVNTNQLKKKGETLDVTGEITTLAKDYNMLTIKKRDFVIIETETEYIIKFAEKVEQQTTITKETIHQSEVKSTKKIEKPTGLILQLTMEQKQRIRSNRQKALRIRLQKRKDKRIAKRKKSIKYTTKTNKSRLKGKSIPEQMDYAPIIPKLDETKLDTIPALVSFINTDVDPRQRYTELTNQKFFTILIEDFLAAERKFQRPILYEHNSIEFKYVNIVGTIVGVYTNVTDKIQIIVEDTTGRVTCIIEPKRRKRRQVINRRLEKWEEKMKEPRYTPKLKKPELISIMEKTDAQFQRNLKIDKKVGADLLHTYGYILLRKAKKFLIDEYPSKVNLSLTANSIGRHISVTGKAYDWTEERVIYVWDLKFITMDDFFVRIDELYKAKSTVIL